MFGHAAHRSSSRSFSGDTVDLKCSRAIQSTYKTLQDTDGMQGCGDGYVCCILDAGGWYGQTLYRKSFIEMHTFSDKMHWSILRNSTHSECLICLIRQRLASIKYLLKG